MTRWTRRIETERERDLRGLRRDARWGGARRQRIESLLSDSTLRARRNMTAVRADRRRAVTA